MNIVVTLKQVHDSNLPRSALKIGTDGRTLSLPSGAVPILNGYDGNALEEALKLRDARSGKVTAVSVGDDSAKAVLTRAIAMGADQVLHIRGPSGLEDDSHSVATLLAAGIKSLDDVVDLVLSGRQASDTDGGVVPLLLASYLGYPAISPVRAVKCDGDSTLLVERITEGAIQRLRVLGPVVLGVSNEINKPRSPSLRGVMNSKRAVIPTKTSQDLGVSIEPALCLQRLYVRPTPSVATEIISGPSAADAGRALADRLHQEGLI
jgi:electron transfer flavoprotein beta subunit